MNIRPFNNLIIHLVIHLLKSSLDMEMKSGRYNEEKKFEEIHVNERRKE